MKTNLPLKQIKLPALPHSKSGRLKLAGGAAVAVVLLIALLSYTPEPAPQHDIVPTVVAQQAPAPQALPAPPNSNNSQIVLELFSPSDRSLTNQITETTLSQQIEQTMTISFVLTKCQIISQDDYRDTFRALLRYAQLTKLAGDESSAETIVRQISESAKASYALVYSRTSCNDPQLPTVANQLLQWTRSILQ